MPAPSTVVTFRDADGDEFPIRLEGHGWDEPLAESEALKRLVEFEATGDLTPRYPIVVSTVEEWHAVADVIRLDRRGVKPGDGKPAEADAEEEK